jgi:hypothetical protein
METTNLRDMRDSEAFEKLREEMFKHRRNIINGSYPLVQMSFANF